MDWRLDTPSGRGGKPGTAPTERDMAALRAFVRRGGLLKLAAHDLGLSMHTLEGRLQRLRSRLRVGSNIEALEALGWLHEPPILDNGPAAAHDNEP